MNHSNLTPAVTAKPKMCQLHKDRICWNCVLINWLYKSFCLPDSTGPMSAVHTHPPHMGGMMGHPSVISSSRPLPSPMSTLGSPMNGLASPYPVITSSLGSPSVSLPSTPNMNFGQLNSPQVRKRVWAFWWSSDSCDSLNCFFFRWNSIL